MSIIVKNQFSSFNETSGLPLENGYVYIGDENQDAKANPAAVFWDAALTVAAAQPIRTLGGLFINNGVIADIFTAKKFSIRVEDKNGAMIYEKASNNDLTAGDLKTLYEGNPDTNALTDANLALIQKIPDINQVGISSTPYKNAASYQSSRPLAFRQVDSLSFEVFRHLLGSYWMRYVLYRPDLSSPINLSERWIENVTEFVAARDAGVTYTGSWATDTGTTALKASDDTFISGRAQQAISAGDSVTINFTGGGDVYVNFSARSTGAYVTAQLDGSDNFLTLQKLADGSSYFDGYDPANLLHAQRVQIASGVPNGTHSIKLTVSTQANPLNATSIRRFVFNAISFSGENTNPSLPTTGARPWTSGEDVLESHEREHLGRFYYATSDGTTGTNPPTHAAGTVSDGSIAWAQKGKTSHKSTSHRLQARGSQLEYAYEISPPASNNYEDVGGLLHGNETPVSLDFYISGNKFMPTPLKWVVGEAVSYTEKTTAHHTAMGGAANPVVATTKFVSFTNSGVRKEGVHEALQRFKYGYFYTDMWPLLHSSSVDVKFGFTDVIVPSLGRYKVSDYYGNTAAELPKTKDLCFIAEGEVLMPDGTTTAHSTVPGTHRARAILELEPQNMNVYGNNGDFGAYVDMNTNGANPITAPRSSCTLKFYFQRHSRNVPTTVEVGTKIHTASNYRIDIFPN